ncbi:MAG: sulfotransferase [Gammaproteobacteria bacterium]|nr:sulfotransferase [Gammaproteobacteria bacterium]MDH5691891.1 sulfotransferase [Gammaproteobacteria bacterium]
MTDIATKQPIFILGIPRSGTSLVTAILHACGVFLGITVPGGGSENPLGFFENIYLREQVNKWLLEKMGVDILGVKTLPPLDQLPRVTGLEDTVRGLLEHEGYQNDMAWAFKDCKLTLLWPIYLQAFPDAKWVIVRRDDEGIINSCLKTSFMRQHSEDPQFWKQWIFEYQKRLLELKKTTPHYQEIWPETLMNGNTDSAQTLIQWLGLEWNEAEVRALLHPEFWHAA